MTAEKRRPPVRSSPHPDPTADNLHGGNDTALVIGASMVVFLAVILNHFVASHATARAVTATH